MRCTGTIMVKSNMRLTMIHVAMRQHFARALVMRHSVAIYMHIQNCQQRSPNTQPFLSPGNPEVSSRRYATLVAIG